MKTQIIDIFKGMAIGISNIIPGLSGGTIAVVLNIYDKLIFALKDLLKHPIKAIKQIWGILIGIILGIVLGVYLVVKMINAFPIPTMMLFVGLIIGAIPQIYQNICKEKIKFFDTIIFLLMIILLVALVGMKEFLPTSSMDVSINFWGYLVLFFVGAIIAATMIIPGVSGSMVLLVIGLYVYVNQTIKSFIDELFTFDISSILTHMLPLIPLGIGIIVGVVLISKLIANLIKNHRCEVYVAILGLLVASPFVIIYSMIQEYQDVMSNNLVVNIIIGIVTLMIGSAVSLFLATKGDKNE